VFDAEKAAQPEAARGSPLLSLPRLLARLFERGAEQSDWQSGREQRSWPAGGRQGSGSRGAGGWAQLVAAKGSSLRV